MSNRFRIEDDSLLLREMRKMSQSDLADKLGLGIATINRWENKNKVPTAENLEKFYSYAYRSGIRLNKIKEQFYKEELDSEDMLLFHGAKTVLDGEIRADESRYNNDFGQGFYMGETFRQAALFVSSYESSSVYCIKFKNKGLKRVTYVVNTEWMLTVACFRGRLKKRISAEKQSEICSRAEKADIIVAPIADNRMYQIIDSFVDGEITDEQCRHALSATDLGMQHVIKTARAAKCAEALERCFLCSEEKNDYLAARRYGFRAAEDKVRAARIKYRGKGRYIDELL